MTASRSRAWASSAASCSADQAGWWWSRRASIPIASGRYPHSLVMSRTAASPARIPGRAASQASSVAASSTGRVSRLITAASSSAVSRRRLVTSTRLPAVPGSSGRTCSCPAASSSSSRIFLPAAKSRHRPARASSPGGICWAPTPAVSSKLASASAGSTGRWPAVWACSGKKNCPSGKLPVSRWAACTAKVVLPIPAIPSIAQTPTTPPAAATMARVPISCASSAWRPVKAAISRGRPRVAAAANAPAAASCRAASTSAAGARPRAAATNSACAGSARPSASASSSAVSLWAVRWMPRSRSLTDRGDRPAASASSSWVSLASARNCRSNPANSPPGCSATAPHAPQTLPVPTGADPDSCQEPTQTRSPQSPASTGQRRTAAASPAPRTPDPRCRGPRLGWPLPQLPRAAGLCGVLCGRSRVVNPLAAGDGGTSRGTAPTELISGEHQATGRTCPRH